MREFVLKIDVGIPLQLAAVGDYVRVQSSTVKLLIESPDNGEILNLEAGDAVTLTPFKRLNISHSSGSEQTITVLVGNRTRADSSKVGGNVVASPSRAGGAVSHFAVTVTNLNGMIDAANSNRSYIFIQNKSLTGNIWINLNGFAATTSNGIKIPPGGYYESNAAWVSTAQINAIGDIASNPDVLVVEGV